VGEIMYKEKQKIDKKGRLKLPKKILDLLGIQPETDVIIELTESGILIKPQHEKMTITKRIGEMELPAGEWKQIEKEIIEEHLKDE